MARGVHHTNKGTFQDLSNMLTKCCMSCDVWCDFALLQKMTSLPVTPFVFGSTKVALKKANCCQVLFWDITFDNYLGEWLTLQRWCPFKNLDTISTLYSVFMICLWVWVSPNWSVTMEMSFTSWWLCSLVWIAHSFSSLHWLLHSWDANMRAFAFNCSSEFLKAHLCHKEHKNFQFVLFQNSWKVLLGSTASGLLEQIL